MWRRSLRWLVVGLLLGGMTTWLLVGLVAELLPPNPAIGLVAVGVVSIYVVAVEFELVDHVIQRKRLIPTQVVRKGPYGALQFGFEMGLGTRTFAPSALPLLGVVGCAVFGGLPQGVLTGMGFGIGRAMMAHGYRRWNESWVEALGRLRWVLVAGFLSIVAVTVLE